jgi:hypothetical protein
MSRSGIFLAYTQAEVEAILASAKTLITQGKTMMKYEDSGTSVEKQFAMPVKEVIEEARYALQIKDPITYGKIDRVRVINFLNNFRGL